MASDVEEREYGILLHTEKMALIGIQSTLAECLWRPNSGDRVVCSSSGDSNMKDKPRPGQP